MAKPRLSVLLISPLPPPVGGIATWTALICRRAAACPGLVIRVLDTAVRWRDTANTSLRLRLMGGLVHAAAVLCQFLFRALGDRPDVVHLCTSAYFSLVKDCAILAACRLLRLRSILHFHFGRIPELAERRNWEWRLLCLAVRLCSEAIPIDRRSCEALAGRFPGKTLQLPNMIDLEAVHQATFGGSPTGAVPASTSTQADPLIVFVGYVMPTKGVAELLTAAARLRREYPLRLRIIGPVPAGFLSALGDRDELRDGSSEEWLSIVGSLPHEQVLSHMAQATVFCLPSYTEGFPFVIMEAMALGKPIVTTPVGAIPEMLDIGGPEECGVCVPAKDADRLTDALRQVLQQPAIARDMGHRASLRCRREYDVDAVFGRLRSLWEKQIRIDGRDACRQAQKVDS